MIENFIMLGKPIYRLIIQTIAVLFLTYAITGGLLTTLPRLAGLGQTARNLFYHVPMWFTMYLMMFISVISSVLYLNKLNLKYDLWARESAFVGIFFGLLGLTTGIVWSRVTWGELLPSTNPSAWWSWDPKQTNALISILIYAAYFVLRGALEEDNQRARIAGVYNIFAAASIVPLTFIIPRALGGLHPGAGGGGPVFNQADISNDYRMIFYPAIIGFMALAVWITDLRIRIRQLESISEQ